MNFKTITQPEKKMTFAVVGLRQGCNHIEALLSQPNAEIVAISDLNADHRQRAQNLLTHAGKPKAQEFANLDELLKSIAVDGICLALPIALNGPATIQCLEAGFNVFCEKPIANNFDDAGKIQELVEKKGLIYQVGFELRHSPLVQAVMGHIADGRLGTVTAISGYHFWRPNREHFAARGKWAYSKWSGSVLMDCMSHTFDMINLFEGSRVAQVYADLGFVTEEYREIEAPEVGAVSVGYESGVKAGITLTETCHQPHQTMVTIAGTDGKIEISYTNGGSYKLWFGRGFHKEESIDPTTTSPGHLGWDEEFIEFRNAIVEKRTPYCRACPKKARSKTRLNKAGHFAAFLRTRAPQHMDILRFRFF